MSATDDEAQGRQALAANDIAAALAWYRRAAEGAPEDAALRANFGVVQKRAGLLQEAIASYRLSLQLNPKQPSVHANLGRALREAGLIDLAVQEFRQAVRLQPRFAEVWSMLSNALREAGDAAGALDAARSALECKPTLPEAHLNEGAALQCLGQLEDAAISYFLGRSVPGASVQLTALLTNRTGSGNTPRQRAPQLLLVQELLRRPQDSALWLRLARWLEQQGRHASATCCLSQVVELSPTAQAHRDLGAALLKLGNPEQARGHLEAALGQNPVDQSALVLLGRLHLDRNEHALAEKYLRNAVEQAPRDLALLHNLGLALQAQGKPVAASDLYRKVLTVSPRQVEAHINLGIALADQAYPAAALQQLKKGLDLAPTRADLHSAVLFAMHFDGTVTPQALLDAHQDYQRRHGQPLRANWPRAYGTSDPDRRLRIGYVSADFRQHPVAHFIEPVLSHHDSTQVEVFCYADLPRVDSVSERLARHVNHWRLVHSCSDAALAQLIREDQIDILIDLAGHTGKNRLLVFARKPAPVQVAWLGYFNTTGLSAMDYRIADWPSVPEGTERLFVEKVFRLPRTANCYLPPSPCPDLTEAPATRGKGVTFGCFNNPAKLNREVVRLFGRILQEVGGSRLILKYGAFAEPALRAQYRSWFAAEGIGEERLEFREHSSMNGFLASFADIDLALDPFPYSGETTALHTLIMGVPLITLEGPTLVQRLAARVLRISGFPEWVASSPDEYLQIARSLASDPLKLSELRPLIRQRLEGSPLLDHRGFTRELESAFRTMWQEWCAQDSRQ